MNRYRVTCDMRSERDWSKVVTVFSEAKHPDLAKQMLLSLYPRHIMENIHITDLTPMRPIWSEKIVAESKSPKNTCRSHVIDLDRTWKKELAR